MRMSSPRGSRALLVVITLLSLVAGGAASAQPDDSCGVPPGTERCALWTSSYDGAGGADRFDDMVVDPAGSAVFATGRTGAADGTFKFVTSGMGAESGHVSWTSLYDGPGDGDDIARDMAISPEGGFVYVAGDSMGDGTFSDIATVSYDAFTGEQRWVARFEGAMSDTAVALGLSPDGARVYVTGYTDLPEEQGEIAAITIAYDAYTGDELWRRVHRGPAAFWDIPRAMTVAKHGDADRVLVAMRSNVQGNGNNQVDAALIAYDGETGSDAWSAYYDYYGTGTSREEPWAVTTTADGARAYVVAEGPFGYNTLAYSATDGSFLWRAIYNGSSRPLGIAVSPSGATIVATGNAMHQQAGNFYRAVDTVAYSSSGSQLWADRFFPTGGGTGIRVAFEPGGRHVYVAGLLVGQAVGTGVQDVGAAQVSYSGMLTLGYAAGTGARVWQGAVKDSGGANGIAVHPNGARIFVAGGANDAVAAGYDTGFDPPQVEIPTLTVSATVINAANQHAVTLSGTARENTGVIVTVASPMEGRGCSLWAYDGTYTCTTNVSGLPDGMLEARARGYDGIGGYSDFVRIPIRKDTVAAAPSVTIRGPINQSNAAAIEVVGSAEPGATVALALTDGTDTVETSTTAPSGSYRALVDVSSLADGTVTATGVQTDTAGNVSAPGSGVAVKDTVAPAAPEVLAPIPGATFTTNTVRIAGTAEPDAVVFLSEGTAQRGNVRADASGAWAIDVRNLTNGTHTITARARDAAGNLGPASTVTFTISQAVPDAPVITAPANGASVPAAVTITGTAPSGATVRVYEGARIVGSTTASAGAWQIAATLTDGPHTIQAVATSRGVASAASSPVSFTVDAYAPSVVIATSDRSAHTESFTARGTATDNRVVERIAVTVTDALGTQVFSGDAVCERCGTTSASWSVSPSLASGVYRVQAIAYDAVGNRSGARTITIVKV